MLGSDKVPLAITTPRYSAVSVWPSAVSVVTRQRVSGASLTGSTRRTRTPKRKCWRKPKWSAKAWK